MLLFSTLTPNIHCKTFGIQLMYCWISEVNYIYVCDNFKFQGIDMRRLSLFGNSACSRSDNFHIGSSIDGPTKLFWDRYLQGKRCCHQKNLQKVYRLDTQCPQRINSGSVMMLQVTRVNSISIFVLGQRDETREHQFVHRCKHWANKYISLIFILRPGKPWGTEAVYPIIHPISNTEP